MIRPVNKTDRGIFVELCSEFFNSPAVSHSIPTEYHQNTFNELMQNDCYVQAYIFETQAGVAGYALTCKTFSSEVGGIAIWIEEIYVRDSFRGNGIGQEFFTYLEKNKAPNVKRFRLEVQPDNQKATALYERIGFEVLGYTQMVKDF